MSPKQHTAHQCQFQNARGQRCNMLIDSHHPPANGTASSTLCPFHAERLRATVPVVDPDVLADELLTDINSFTTAGEVNLFLGNLVNELARKRISRRDAIALAYISQLILTSQSAMAREEAARLQAEKDAAHDRMIASIRTRSRPPDSLANQQSSVAAAQPSQEDPHRPA